MFKMLQHIWLLRPGNMSVVCLGWCTMTCTGWLFLNECSTSLLWQSIVVFGTELQGISRTTVCQSLKLLVASTCDLPDVINCQFCEFAATPLGPVHFLSPDQESGIHWLIICGIQLLTPNNLGETWRRICSLDSWSVSALEVLHNRPLQIDLLTYSRDVLCHLTYSFVKLIKEIWLEYRLMGANLVTDDCGLSKIYKYNHHQDGTEIKCNYIESLLFKMSVSKQIGSILHSLKMRAWSIQTGRLCTC